MQKISLTFSRLQRCRSPQMGNNAISGHRCIEGETTSVFRWTAWSSGSGLPGSSAVFWGLFAVFLVLPSVGVFRVFLVFRGSSVVFPGLTKVFRAPTTSSTSLGLPGSSEVFRMSSVVFCGLPGATAVFLGSLSQVRKVPPAPQRPGSTQTWRRRQGHR